MELTEPIESINKQLKDLFGIDTITSQPMFRVVWSEDQYEKRLTHHSPFGIELPTPIVAILPKYKQWIQEKWVLERLVLVPEVNADELPTQKLSYEPLWVFVDRHGEALPPTVWACKFTIDSVYAAMGKSGMKKYVDEEAKNPQLHKENRLKKMEEELFGNESPMGDALAHKEATGYTGPTKEN